MRLIAVMVTKPREVQGQMRAVGELIDLPPIQAVIEMRKGGLVFAKVQPKDTPAQPVKKRTYRRKDLQAEA